MATIAARLAKLEQRRREQERLLDWAILDAMPISWLELAALIAGMAEAGYFNFETGQWQITDETSGPLYLDEVIDGLPYWLAGGQLRQEQGYYFAAAPQDDAGRPFYDWLAGALNQQPTAAR